MAEIRNRRANQYRRHNRHVPRRKSRSKKIFTVFLAALCLVCFILLRASDYHPSAQVAQLILINAERYKLQPELLQAVIEVESKYDEKAVSHVGAVGAMQLVPTTARWIAQESGNPYGDLKDPAINIPLGAWYLRYLINKYHGNLELALAAYNAGRGNVDTWIREKNWPDDFNDIDAIPFPETQGFVTQVIRIKEELKEKHEIQKLKAQQAPVAQTGHTDKNTKVG